MRRYIHNGVVRWDKSKDRYIPPNIAPKKKKPRREPKPKPVSRQTKAKIRMSAFLTDWKGEVFQVRDFALHSGYRTETARRILDRDGYTYEKQGQANRNYNTEECRRISNETN